MAILNGMENRGLIIHPREAYSENVIPANKLKQLPMKFRTRYESRPEYFFPKIQSICEGNK
jgi:hypothetical protein